LLRGVEENNAVRLACVPRHFDCIAFGRERKEEREKDKNLKKELKGNK
jgi:hypothetical protein